MTGGGGAVPNGPEPATGEASSGGAARGVVVGAVGELAMFEVALPGAAVRFSTRLGGVSEGPYGSLNLGIQTDDDVERVVENRRLLSAGVGLAPADVVIGRQVHGAEIARWDGVPRPAFDDATGERPAVDGHVTGEPGVGLLVQVADCLPMALASPQGVAMVHCGWRGVAAGIVHRAVGELRAVAACAGDAPAAADGPVAAAGVSSAAASGSGPVAAAIGPGIGRCCFEVGPEVLEPFADVSGAVDPPRGRADGGMLDLRRVVEARLRAAGVERVEHVDLCTHCRDDLFFSHRRDGGVTGRQCGIVWRT